MTHKDDWAPLFQSPGPAEPPGPGQWSGQGPGQEPSQRLREEWARNLGVNQALPVEVMLRLLGRSTSMMFRRLPPVVLDAAVDHPAWKVRGMLVETRQDLTADQWARLLLGEPEAKRRAVLAGEAQSQSAPLTEAGHRRLAADPDPGVRAEIAALPGLPAHLRTRLATDPEPAVRARACPDAWPHLSASVRDGLLADPDQNVRKAALLRHHKDHPMPLPVYEKLDSRKVVAATCRLDRVLAEHLTQHGDAEEREALARNPHLDPDLIAALAADPEDYVRYFVSVRPDLTEEQRAAVLVEIDPHIHRHPPEWIVELHDDPDAMRRCAASSHLLLRRGAARARHLPPDVVQLLSQDEDRVVRLFLAESCDDAPADLLLEVCSWWDSSLSFPDRPRGHPNFPRRGLLRFADDPNPRMRRLALDDPDCTAQLVERFSLDADELVRVRAAKDPRLSGASLVRLSQDPKQQIRYAAMMNPSLPPPALVRLLLDPDTAAEAARNTGLPVFVMHRLVDLLGE